MLKTNKMTCDHLLIMAGGRSTRMGSDKASLPFGDLSLIETLILRFSPYFSHIFISLPADSVHVISNLRQYDVQLIFDVVVDCGPLGGLYSFFDKTAVDSVCVCPVDLPFADPKLLIQCIPENRSAAEKLSYCVAVCHDMLQSDGTAQCDDTIQCTGMAECNDTAEYIQPLFGWYHRKIFDSLKRAVMRNQYRMLDLLDSTEGLKRKFNTGMNCGDCFYNMNDRESYYHALDYIRHQGKAAPIIAFVGWSGSGKTTLIENLIPYLVKYGMRIAVIKHHGHSETISSWDGKAGRIRELKDTDRFLNAGAYQIFLISGKNLMSIHKNIIELTPEKIATTICGVDLIIVEGYKYSSLPKIEVHRSEISKFPIKNLSNRVALVSDQRWNLGVPEFFGQNYSEIAEFLQKYVEKHKM